MELKTRSKDNNEELMANLKLPLKKTTLILVMVSKKGQKEWIYRKWIAIMVWASGELTKRKNKNREDSQDRNSAIVRWEKI